VGEDELSGVPSTQPTRSFWNSTDRVCSCNTDVLCPNFYLPQAEECIPCRRKNRGKWTRNRHGHLGFSSIWLEFPFPLTVDSTPCFPLNAEYIPSGSAPEAPNRSEVSLRRHQVCPETNRFSNTRRGSSAEDTATTTQCQSQHYFLHPPAKVKSEWSDIDILRRPKSIPVALAPFIRPVLNRRF